MSKDSISVCLVGLAIAVFSSTAQAAIIYSGGGTSTLANSQVEAGGDTSENPDVTGGAAGTLIPYTPSGSFFTGDFGPDNLSDGDVGAGNLSDGKYALTDKDTTVTLDFGSLQTVGSIAIYSGYSNRVDGDYLLKDAGGTTLGSWTINSTPSSHNAGVDSFWITLDAPVSTTGLSVEASNQTDLSGSYREIQVFAAVPEPSTAILAGFGLIGMVLARRKRS